jgi:phytoene dehydrogenase-like protein
VLECTIPSAVDPTVAPPGRHLMSMFVQYAPYDLRDVLDRQVLTPLDLERVFNLIGGKMPASSQNVASGGTNGAG